LAPKSYKKCRTKLFAIIPHGLINHYPTFWSSRLFFPLWGSKLFAIIPQGLINHYLGLLVFDQSRLQRAYARSTGKGGRGFRGHVQEQRRYGKRYIGPMSSALTLCTGSASAFLRRETGQNGFESYRKLCQRYMIPGNAKSVGRLSKILRPNLNNDPFEDSFSSWEDERQKYEKETKSTLSDDVKVPVLLLE